MCVPHEKMMNLVGEGRGEAVVVIELSNATCIHNHTVCDRNLLSINLLPAD